MKRLVLTLTVLCVFAMGVSGADALHAADSPHCVIPSQAAQYSCLSPAQMSLAQRWMHWMIDPTAIVDRYTHLRLKGMLVELRRGRPADIALAYGATRYYTSTAAHIPSHPNFVDVGEVGTTGFPVGIRVIAQPNGTLFVEAGMVHPKFGFTLVTNEPRSVTNRMAHAIWHAAAGRR